MIESVKAACQWREIALASSLAKKITELLLAWPPVEVLIAYRIHNYSDWWPEDISHHRVCSVLVIEHFLRKGANGDLIRRHAIGLGCLLMNSLHVL